MVTNQRLYIRRGILSKKVQQTRIDRVQNVNTDQRFRDRLLRVGTVDFDTAGTDDSEFRFVGISDPVKVAAAVDQAQRERGGANLGEPGRDGEAEHGHEAGGAARLLRRLGDHRVDEHDEQRAGREAVDRRPQVAAGGVGDRVAGDRRDACRRPRRRPTAARIRARLPAAVAQVRRRADRLGEVRDEDRGQQARRSLPRRRRSRSRARPAPACRPAASRARASAPSPSRSTARSHTKYVSAPMASPAATAAARRPSGPPRTGRS